MFTESIQKKCKRLLFVTIVMFTFCLFVIPTVVSAQGSSDDPFGLQSGDFADNINLGKGNLITIIANGIQIFLGLLGIIAILIVLYAGFLWMTSQGDEEKIATAKKILVNAVIGLAIILSSYAITAFIISKLTDATGYTGGTPGPCADPVYATAHTTECGRPERLPDVCDEDPASCLDAFVVKTITPVTADTGMNNIVIRVIFSKSVVTAPESTIIIRKGSDDITRDFVYTWVGSRRVLEARMPGSGFLGSGSYSVGVSADVRSVGNEVIRETVSGVSYPTSADFTISTEGVTDSTAPELNNSKINGVEGVRHIVRRGSESVVSSNVSDDRGVGLVRLGLQTDFSGAVTDVSYNGPRITRGSDAPSSNPFAYSDSLFFANNTIVPARYFVNLIAKDIDSNTSPSYSTEVIVVGENCDGTGGAIDPERPSGCLAEPGGPCTEDWQCVSGVCDETIGQCLPYPIILDVSPWSGAPGNMVTVIGKYFGSTAGHVYFGYDRDGSGTLSDTEWVEALPPALECPDASLWTDNWAIVKVPPADLIPVGASSSIRIVRGDGTGYEDTTVDVRGPKAGDPGFVGYFETNNESAPGLCSVKTTDTGAVAAVPDTNVVARGVGFGDSSGQITFAGRQGVNVSAWSNFSAQAKIPDNLLPGKINVKVIDRSSKVSNGVPFTILRQGVESLPLIEAIDPPTTTRQSFITIQGKRFGSQVGRVWVSLNADDISLCSNNSARPASCIEVGNGGFNFCSNFWKNDQIFIYIPEIAVSGSYFVLVQTATGLQTSGVDRFSVVDGPPRASICSLDPSSGPAPLPVGHVGLRMRGINFFTESLPVTSNSTTAYFWKNGASLNNPRNGSWLSSRSVSDPDSTISSVQSNSTTIVSIIPVASGGVSMQTGPIVVYRDPSDSQGRSNSAVYTVASCIGSSEASAMESSGYQCCTEGPETGLWKRDTLACEGQTRDAGYVWRFTTGKLSNRPKVVEECREDGDIPSPVPSTLHPSGLNACINQMVVVRFDMNADTVMVGGSSVANSVENKSNVKLFSCGTGDSFTESSCTTEITSTTLLLSGKVLTVYDAGAPGGAFDSNRWYRVVLSKQIQGLTVLHELGGDRQEYVTLKSTRPCTQAGIEYAYCFEFKTSALGEQCVLTSAGITPRLHETYILGRVVDVLQRAIVFQVFGRGNQSCSVLNVDGLGWVWSNENSSLVSSVPMALPRSPNDSKAYVDALNVTDLTGSDIFAEVEVPRVTREVVSSLPTPTRSLLFDEVDVSTCTISLASSSFKLLSSRTPCPINSFSPLSIGGVLGGNALKFISNRAGGSPQWPYIETTVSSSEIGWSPFVSSSFSFSVWVRPGSVVQSPDINNIYNFRMYNAVTNKYTYFRVMLYSANRVVVNVLHDSVNKTIQSNNAIPIDTWSHVGVTYNRISGTLGLWVNGVLLKSLSVSIPTDLSSISNNASIRIGEVGDSGVKNDYNFDIDNITTYNQLLSSAQMGELADTSVTPGLFVRATSTIIINPGKPKVIDYWPLCTEACVNAGIGAVFSRDMVSSTYGAAGAFSIRKCDNESCDTGSNVPTTIINLDTAQSDSRRIIFNLQGTNVLSTSTWYRVTLNSPIRAFGGLSITGAVLQGDSIDQFSWKFRTKEDGSLCTVAGARVLPISFVANVVSQKTLYSGQALSAPDTCNPRGQVLNPWSFDWSWSSVSTSVATVSNFKSSGAHYSWCTNECLPSGSIITKSTSTINYPICGNGVVDAGEDCDIAIAGEVLGTTCTYSCLRSGNSLSSCGDGVVSSTLGEECDPGAGGANEFCSASCLNLGSSSNPTGSVESAICGSGSVTRGEECEVGQPGCNSQCLHTGTQLSRSWCDSRGFSTSTILTDSSVQACRDAVSVCGNGRVESGEQCEVGIGGATDANCSNSCLIKSGVDVCGTSLSQCTPSVGNPGCSINCTLLGSSILYNNPSVCGDITSGVGKDLSCEVGSVPTSRLGLPVQVATAVGLGELASSTGQFQQTQINATVQSANASGEYYFQCGYTEYETPIGGRPNNCVDPTNGVGTNSCCYPRPTRVSEYPVNGEVNVCRNTYIETKMRGYIDKDTLSGNVRIISYHPGATSCPGGLSDVTLDYNDASIFTIARDSSVLLPADANFIERIWFHIRSFFARLFGESANADTITGGKLCAGIPVVGSVTISGDGTYANTTSTIRLQIGTALAPNTYYYVVLKGGKSGITDKFKVGIKHPTTASLSDAWWFRTKDEICKLDSVAVEPASKLFNKPDQLFDFSAIGKTREGDSIVSIPNIYAYDWMWVPGGNPLFEIPVAGSERSNTSTVSIASKNIEGSLYASAVAIVTADTDTTRESHLNKTFSGRTLLTSVFCNNIWPTPVGETWNQFEDTSYNFKTFYCADSGVLGNTADDLPVLSVVSYAGDSEVGGTVFPGSALTDDDVLRRYLLVSDRNDDVIGVQIVSNPNRLSVSDWYKNRFGSVNLQPVAVDGYEALTNGDSFYVGAYNEVTTPRRTLHNNIYVVTINQGAQANTRSVLDQMIRNWKFNINIYDDQYCLTTSTSRTLSAKSCMNDFDCRSANGTPLVGLSGVCGNDRTKLFQDLKRLQDVGAFQRAVDRYKSLHSGSVPTLSAGTYYPSYTNSMWPSWQGTLGSSDALSAALPRDPINRWSQCGDEGINSQTCWNQVSSTYACPAFSQIYEYKQNSTSTYTLHAQFEYVNNGATIYNASGTPFINDFINPALVSYTPWCVGEVRSPFGESCGDGIIQPSESCELGQTRIVPRTGGSTSQTCAADCSGWVDSGIRNELTCGNGIVEASTVAGVPSEVCDDGVALNGTYGHCASNCLGQFAAYCGNRILDRLSSTQPLEYCDSNIAGVCEYVTESGFRIKPKVYVLLDKSGSMTGLDGGTVSRWNRAKSGLDQFANTMGASVEVGVSVFSGAGTCGDPREVLPVGEHTIVGIQDSYASEIPNSSTPTDLALQYVYIRRDSIFGSDSDVPKYVILITDGKPECTTTDNATRQAGAVAAAELLRKAGISVYVIGFGNVADQSLKDNLNAIASAGGTDNISDDVNRFYDASNASQLSSALRSILSCSPYSNTKAGSCSYDCQSVGSYCGDGVTDIQFGEQCDDGNSVPDDGCTNICTTVVNTQIPQRDPGRHYCGDGVRDWDDRNGDDRKDPNENWIEACDTGAGSLGVRPDASSIPYGEVRTYCSVDCQDILTVDADARCGNGKRDQDASGAWIEECDTVSGGSGVTRDNAGTALVACSDKGSRTCTNSCQTFTDGCLACNVSSVPTVAGYAQPMISFINPMTNNIAYDWIPNVDRPIIDSPVSLALNRKGQQLTMSNETFGGALPAIFGVLGNYINPFILASGSNPNNLRLQASLTCSEEYELVVNGASDRGGGTRFPYPVNGELGQVKNEYVFSPAVPINTYRVVARWSSAETSQDATFVIGAYSDGFSSTKKDVNITNMWGVLGGICRSVESAGSRYSGYWWPVIGGFGTGCQAQPNDSTNPVVYTHDWSSLEKTFVQSMTIDTTRMPASGSESIAVYVSAIRSIVPSNIQDFKNSNLVVDIYTYHSGQNPRYSIYAPSTTISIKDAVRSANPDAQYWHVFNFVKNTTTNLYEIQPPTSTALSGSIITDMCGIRSQLPRSSLCAP